jgi:hypothetical protein
MGRELAAATATAILAALMLFQIALAAGYPLGALAWGGYHTVLPAGLRAASLFSVALYAAIMAIVLTGAGLLRLPFGQRPVRMALLALTGFFSLGVLMNLASQSPWERAIMTPVALVLALCCHTLARPAKT